MSKVSMEIGDVLDEAALASDALEDLKENIATLKSTYQEILDDQRSGEFIKEFNESIGEIIEKVDELANSSIGQIIAGIQAVAQEIESVDGEISSQM